MAIDFISWIDQSEQDHRARFADALQRGYRTASLCLSGTAQRPGFTATMIHDPLRVAEEFALISESTWAATFAAMDALGLGASIVSGVGAPSGARFAVLFVPMEPRPRVLRNLTASDLAAQQDQAWNIGEVLAWIDAYGTMSDPRFVAIWVPNTAPVAWNLALASQPLAAAEFQRDGQAIAAQGGRPALLAVTPGAARLALYVDDSVGRWQLEHDLSPPQITARIAAHRQRGLAPLRLWAKTIGGGPRCGAIFAEHAAPLPRSFRASGPVSLPAIDALMQAFMQRNATRGAALAITSGTRLVYARGYTLAEAAYPDVLPVTPFRLASVSKTLCAIAVFQLLQEERIALDTTIQSVLNLKTSTGAPPADARFACITVRDLLTMTSALNLGAFASSGAAAAQFGKPLPATPEQMLSFVASLPLDGNPGNWDNAAYSNTGYMLLGLLVARLRGAGDFAAAIGAPLLAPLGITRIRGARSRLADQPGDEARYHLSNLRRNGPGDELRSLDVGISVRTSTPTVVPSQYGVGDYEMFGAGGGMSAAAVDLARIAAALCWRDPANPMLSPAWLDALFGNAVRATSALTGPDAHGYFGFDGASIDPADRSISATKGGWLPGNQSFFWVTNQGEGNGVVLLINTNEQDDSGFGFGELLGEVTTLVAGADWSTAADHFLDFGMPPLVAQPVVKPPPILDRPDSRPPSARIAHLADLERASMTRPVVTPPGTRPRRRR